MASFQIYEDQENVCIAGSQQVSKDIQKEKKRTVLGVINNKNVRVNNVQHEKSKQVFQKDHKNVSKVGHTTSQQTTLLCQKNNNASKKPTFKIYEEKLDEKKKAISRENVKITKAQCQTENQDQKFMDRVIERLAAQNVTVKEEDKVSPMLLDKSATHSISPMEADRSRISTPSKSPVRHKSYEDLLIDVEEYKEDIYQFMRELEAESRHRPKPGYMRKQPDISYSMRTILVDWLVEVAEEYRLQTETLYLAVSYIDRFLSYMSVMRTKLQLVGTSAMFIAAKYEEIYPPDVSEFVYITDDTYDKSQVLRMEQLILKTLNFNMSAPTTLSFLTYYCMDAKVQDSTKYLAMYISELSLLEADPYLGVLPSEKAASALAIARYEQELEPWTDTLVQITGYELVQLAHCIKSLNKTYTNASTYAQQAIREKYKSHKWQNVALLCPRIPSLLE